SVLWSVANEQPQVAIAGGGVIGTSGINYDQNGGATGQITPYTQSWRGNAYRMGSVERILADTIQSARTLWARARGNPSGNSSAARPWFFMLVWKNNCSSAPPPCGFTLYPDNPQYLPNLAIDATSKATMIKLGALNAFKKAFDKYPVTAVEGSA